MAPEILHRMISTCLMAAFATAMLLRPAHAEPDMRYETLTVACLKNWASCRPFVRISGSGSVEEAVEGWKALCAGDDPAACTLYARALDRGFGVARDPAAAATLFDETCARGVQVACAFRATNLLFGVGEPADPVRAQALLEEACGQGDGVGCANLGVVYRRGFSPEFPRDFERAAKLFGQACALEVPAACYNLAFLYEQGWGVKKRPQRASLFLNAACSYGVGQACLRAGHRHREDKREAVAFALYEAGCAFDDGDACLSKGLALTRGVGAQTDLAAGFEAYEAACALGQIEGCRAAGNALLKGEGTSEDRAAAAQRYRIACEAKDAAACETLEALGVQ